MNEPAELLCGHWTFFSLRGEDRVARCDLPQGHEGMHKCWWNPSTNEVFSWDGSFERHKRRSQ